MDELNDDVKSLLVPTDLTDNVDCNIINGNIKDFDNGLCDVKYTKVIMLSKSWCEMFVS